jgi:hypothetical protein
MLVLPAQTANSDDRVLTSCGTRVQVHVRELPDLPRVLDTALEAPGLLGRADLQPVLQQQDPVTDHGPLDRRGQLQEPLGLLRRAEPHDPLNPGPVVPAPVKDHDLAGGGEVGEVPLDVHLGPLAVGRGGQGNDPEHPRAHPLGDPLDRAALAGGVAALEHDADLGP